MKRLFATAFAAIAFLATVGWNMTAAGYDHQPEPVAVEKARVMHIADGDVTSSASASANRDSIFARNEVASILKGDDPESLRLELLACLLIMVIVPVGALLVICYIDTRGPDESGIAQDEIVDRDVHPALTSWPSCRSASAGLPSSGIASAD